jgi:hypothetical protein
VAMEHGSNMVRVVQAHPRLIANLAQPSLDLGDDLPALTHCLHSPGKCSFDPPAYIRLSPCSSPIVRILGT